MAKSKRLLGTSEPDSSQISRERTSDFDAKKMSEETEQIEMNEHPQLEPEHSGILYSTLTI